MANQTMQAPRRWVIVVIRFTLSVAFAISLSKSEKMGDPLVLTFGKVEPRPNTVNVVPGKTTFTIDCRHTDAAVLRDFTQQLENDMRAICDEMDIGIDIDLWMDEEPVPMNKDLVTTLTELCESEN